MMERAQTTESFVARIWLERGSDSGQVWRGHIRHVQSSEQGYFRTSGEMLDFIERVTGVPCGQLHKGQSNKKTTP